MVSSADEKGSDADSATTPTVRLHVKILVDPTSFPINQMVANMRAVYASVGIAVTVASTERLQLPSLETIDVGPCSSSGITDDQREIFGHRNSIGANEVVAYFIRATDPPTSGCAAHPSGRPGAVVVRNASRWTLGHEIGHVLGLSHVPPLDRLMTGNGTANITNPPPDIIASEALKMRNSPFTINIGGGLADEAPMEADMADTEDMADDDIPDDVATFLRREEPDYERGLFKFKSAPGIIEELRRLAQSPADMLLATKALYFLSLIDGPAFVKLSWELRSRAEPEIRAAIAGGTRNVAPSEAAPLILELLDDKDAGVRRTSVRALSKEVTDAASPADKDALGRKLDRIMRTDEGGSVRDLARGRLDQLKSAPPR
jgi:hypothetical protein